MGRWEADARVNHQANHGNRSCVMRQSLRPASRGWVLRSGEEVYRLKTQTGIEEFAGRKVKVIGSLDAKTNTIENVSIEAAVTAKRAASRRP